MTYKEVYNKYMKPLMKRAALDNFAFYDPSRLDPVQQKNKKLAWPGYNAVFDSYTSPQRNRNSLNGYFANDPLMGGMPWTANQYLDPRTPINKAMEAPNLRSYRGAQNLLFNRQSSRPGTSAGWYIDATQGSMSTKPVPGPSFEERLKVYQNKPAPADAPEAPDDVTQQQALNNYYKDGHEPIPFPALKPTDPEEYGGWARQLNEQDRKVIEDRHAKREWQEYNKKMDEDWTRLSKQLDRIHDSKGLVPWDPRLKSPRQKYLDKLRAQSAQADKNYERMLKPKQTAPAKPVETADQTVQRAFGVTEADKDPWNDPTLALPQAERRKPQRVNGYAVQDPRKSGKPGYGKTVYTDKNGKEQVQYTKNGPKPLTAQEQQFWADYNKKQQEKKLADQQRMNNYMQNRQRTFAQGARPRPIRGSRRVYG